MWNIDMEYTDVPQNFQAITFLENTKSTSIVHQTVR